MPAMDICNGVGGHLTHLRSTGSIVLLLLSGGKYPVSPITSTEAHTMQCAMQNTAAGISAQ